MYHLVRAYYLLLSLQLICALILQSVLYVIAVLCLNLPLQTTPTPRFAGLQTVIVREALFGVPEQFGMAIYRKNRHLNHRCHHVTIVGRMAAECDRNRKFLKGVPNFLLNPG